MKEVDISRVIVCRSNCAMRIRFTYLRMNVCHPVQLFLLRIEK